MSLQTRLSIAAYLKAVTVHSNTLTDASESAMWTAFEVAVDLGANPRNLKGLPELKGYLGPVEWGDEW